MAARPAATAQRGGRSEKRRAQQHGFCRRQKWPAELEYTCKDLKRFSNNKGGKAVDIAFENNKLLIINGQAGIKCEIKNVPDFWIRTEESTIVFPEKGGYTLSANTVLKIYTECPVLKNFEAEGILDKVRDVDFNAYLDKEEIIFRKIKDTDSYVKENEYMVSAFDWGKFFKNEKEKIGFSDDSFCDKTELLKKFDKRKWFDTILGNRRIISTERKDCLICYTDNTKTNPAIVKINETEFIPLNIDDFRNSNSTHSGYVRFDSGRYYYITLPAGQDLQAKLVIKNGFKVNENTKASEEPTINIIADDLLGYPALCEETNKTYYDLVAFSTEDLSCLGEDEASFYKKGFVKYDEDANKDDLFVEPKNFWDFFNDKNMIPKIDRNKFLFFGKDGQIDEKELLNFFTSQDESVKECRRNFYKLICRHPLEWDSGFNQKTIKNDYKNVFGKELKGEFYEAWAKNLSDKLAKLSIFEKGFEAATSSKNLFYFMHPLYFLEKVHEDEGLPEALENDKKYLPKEALDLIEVQDKVMALECLKMGNTGIYTCTMTPGQTYCNHAVFLTIIGTDKNFNNFTNREKRLFPECNNLESILNSNLEKKHKNSFFYYSKISNYWCDILEEASKNEKTGIKEINLKQAQKLANQGYVVIVCYKNTNFRHGNNPISPHFATVRPNFNITTYEPSEVQVANVGSENKVMNISEPNCFGTRDISFYYNEKQQFNKDLDSIKSFLRKKT